MHLPALILLAALPAAVSSPLVGQDLPWPARNGALGTGCARAVDARGLPTEWSEMQGSASPSKNIAWQLALEGFGLSTPVIGDGRLWFTSATEDGRQQFVDCIDATTGQVLHHKLLFENAEPEPLANAVNTYASPSCILEADAVYVHFGSYGTARLDPRTADVVWQRRDLPCRHFRGPGSSPHVWQNLIFLTFDGIDQQYVTALDKHTGATVWRTDRSTDYHDLDADGKPAAEGDNRKAYGTPATVEVAGHTQLVSIGSRACYGYDALTGREIWTVTHGDFNAASPPLFYKGMAIMNSGSGGANLMAVRLDDTTRGNVTATHIVWNRIKGNSRLSAPALDGDKLWMIADNGILFALDANTGSALAVVRLGGNFVSSPAIAGEYLFACNDEGRTTVVRTTIPPEIVAKNDLPEGMRASPAIAAGAIYLRTYTKLYKISGEK